MKEQLSKLTQEEQDLLFDSIPLVTILIAGADRKIDEKETGWAEKLTNIRSYAENPAIQDYYEQIRDHFPDRIHRLLDEISDDPEKRIEEASERLAKLNDIFPKIDQSTAKRFYDSLLSFAEHVARASGGFLSFGSVSKAEKDLIGLPMLNPVEFP